MAVMTRKRRRMMAEAAAAAAAATTAVLPEELMIEILARVRVSNPLQLRCVCKWWKSLVVDPQFVKKHLHKSFSDITDLASKAMEDMNAFQLQLNYAYAPALALQEEEEEEEEEAVEEEGEDDEEEEDEDEEEEEEEEEERSVVNELAQLDNMLVVVRSLKGSLETIKVDMQAIKERVKCLQNFLQIYLKTVSSSSSS